MLAFYPGAFTGVCDSEMCSLRDSMAEFNELNANVVGISVDSPFANGGFAGRHNLEFPLLSDFTRDRITSYNVCYTKLLRSLAAGPEHLPGDLLLRNNFV